MTDSAALNGPRAFTCPFCALLCDRWSLRVQPAAGGDELLLEGSRCPRAVQALRTFRPGGPAAAPRIDGQPAALDAALAAAAALLSGRGRPLLGGMATDVAGVRALYPLAARLGAVVDHAGADALLPGLRTLQDRGLYQTTLSEIRSRADLIVCIGSQPGERFPEFYRLIGVAAGADDADAPAHARRFVFLGGAVDPALPTANNVSRDAIATDGDLLATLTTLNALADGRRMQALPALVRLAADLAAARYAVLVWEPGRLAAEHAGTQAELIVELINRLLKTLNLRTRAGGLALAGDDGAASVNQVLGWLSGLPLRTAVAQLDHQPHAYGSARLLAERAVDAVVWVASFGPQTAPPLAAIGDLPLVVLGHPAQADALKGRRAPTVFVPVATPGIDSAGHLFRADGAVMLPLPLVIDSGLPTVAQVAHRLVALLEEGR